MRRLRLLLWLLPLLPLACKPQAPPPQHVPRAHAVKLQQEAVDYYVAGDLGRALNAATKAAQDDPDFYMAQATLGLVCAKRGQVEEAIRALDKAIALAPDYAEGHVLLGIVRERNGAAEQATEEYKRAIAAYDKRIAQPPADPKAAVDRAVAAYLAAGRVEGLIAIDEVVRQYPDFALAAQVRESIRKENRDYFLDWAMKLEPNKA